MFDQTFITNVLMYGGIVIGIVELVKRTIKAKGWVAISISVIASIVVCIPALTGNILEWIVLIACVCLEANGLFKALHANT